MRAQRTCLWALSCHLLLAQEALVQDIVVLRSAPALSAESYVVAGASTALDCCSPFATYGRVTLQAWQLFTSWLSRRGGILVGGARRPLEVRVWNDVSSSASVTAAYTQHTADGISLLLGPFGSMLGMAAAKVANASGALLLSPTASDTAVTKGRPTVFSLSPPAGKFTTSALEALASNQAKTFAYIVENSPAPMNWCRALPRAAGSYGMRLTYSQVLPQNPDRNTTTAAVAALMNASADVVFACVQSSQCLDVANAMLANDFFPGAVVLPACTILPTWNALGEKALFFTGTTPWLPSMPLTSALTGWSAQEFADRFQGSFNELPPFHAAAAFATLEVLVTAIERANSTDVDMVEAQLRSLSLQTVYGSIRFNGDGQVDLDFLTIQAMKVGAAPLIVSPLALAQARMRYPMPNAMERACISTAPSTFAYDSSGACVECPSGYASIWNETAGARSCFFCPPGNLYLGGAACSACPAGKITISAGQTQCTNCSAGTYSASEGQSYCAQCGPGAFAAAGGATSCPLCGPGSFNSEVGQTLCRSCLAGTFGARAGEVGCHSCPAGAYAEAAGVSACVVCSGGRTTEELGAWSASSCVCARGSYLQDEACVQCPPLSTTSESGTTSKSACALNEAARWMIATFVTASVLFPSLFWLVLARLRRRLREAERLRLLALQQQLAAGLKTLNEFQHPMVLVSVLTFMQLTNDDLQGAHESARERGLLRTFDSVAQVSEHRALHPTCRIVMLSYEWLSWVRKGPDRTQAEWMRRALALYCQSMRIQADETYVWLDVLSVPQVSAAVQVLAVNSLYTYAASADALIIIAPPSWHEGAGEWANLETYKMRVWTRMEQVAHVAAHSLDSVYIATEASGLQAVTAEWIQGCIDIFGGQMTCCRLKHKGRDRCDKETLVLPLLGVWYLLSGGAGPLLPGSGASLLHGLMQPRIREIFPASFAFETEEGAERRPLFADFISLLEKHLEQQRGCSRQHHASIVLGTPAPAVPALPKLDPAEDLCPLAELEWPSCKSCREPSWGNLGPLGGAQLEPARMAEEAIQVAAPSLYSC